MGDFFTWAKELFGVVGVLIVLTLGVGVWFGMRWRRFHSYRTKTLAYADAFAALVKRVPPLAVLSTPDHDDVEIAEQRAREPFMLDVPKPEAGGFVRAMVPKPVIECVNDVGVSVDLYADPIKRLIAFPPDQTASAADQRKHIEDSWVAHTEGLARRLRDAWEGKPV